MPQALHIFRKDARYLSREITLVLLFALTFAALHARGPNTSNNSWAAELALVLATALLIGRLVLAEAIPGDRQFWITRPYRWQSLLGAKLLFIVTFVNGPLFLADLLILIIDGFPLRASAPGLLWSQVLLFTFLALPFATLATLSSGMVPFVFTQLIVFAVGFGIWQVSEPIGQGLGSVAWMQEFLVLAALVAIAIPILAVQYKARRTLFSRWLLVAGGIAVGALIFIVMPWPAALALQSHLSKEPSLGSSIRVALGHDRGPRYWIAQMQPKVILHLPISVQSIPNGTEIQADALSLSIQSPDGRTTHLGVLDCSDLKRGTVSASVAVIGAVCMADPAFFQQEHSRPVTLRGSLYFTLFGNRQSQTIPLSDQPSNALDGLQCYTENAKAEWDVYCRSAFRWPSRLVYAKLGHTNANSFTQVVSYSPFPATLLIDPIETRWASAFAAGPAPIVRDVTIEAIKPLAHLRRDFLSAAVQLDEFAYPSYRLEVNTREWLQRSRGSALFRGARSSSVALH